MEIWHRLTFSNKDNVEPKLEGLGIKFTKSMLPGQAYVLHVDMAELDPVWNEVASLATATNALDVFNTVFSQKEIAEADWVRVCPAFEQGYPEPQEGSEWKELTLSSACEECGAGYTQIAPFRVNKEPYLGKNHFVCIIGTYTLFCTFPIAEVLTRERPTGLEFVTPFILSAGQPSKLVTQWRVSALAEPALAEQLPNVICRRCGIPKYAPHMKGYMHLKPGGFDPKADVLLSHEWFGSGHAAYREFFISKRIVQIFLQEEWRGIALKPVKLA